MGFLEAGAPLSWGASARYRDVVKRRGVREFLQLHKQFSADIIPKSTLSWGDEVEYCLLNLDADNKVARLYLGAEEVLGELKMRESLVACERASHRSGDSDSSVRTGQDPSPAHAASHATAACIAGALASPSPTAALSPPAVADPEGVYPEAPSPASGDSKEPAGGKVTTTAGPRLPWQMSNWNPEYGTHMIEAIPGTVYPLRLDSVLDLLPSMQVRRRKVQAVLPPGCYVASMGSFPTMGALERRPRPNCSGSCMSPSCCCRQAAGGGDGSAEGGEAGVDGAVGKSTKWEEGDPAHTCGAASPECCLVPHLRPYAGGGTAASAVTAATDTAAGSGSLEAFNVPAALRVASAGDGVTRTPSAAIQDAGGCCPTAATSPRAAAYPSSSTAKTDENEGTAETSVLKGPSEYLSHAVSSNKLFDTVETVVPSKQVMRGGGSVATAEPKRTVVVTETEEDVISETEKAASRREQQTGERDKQTMEEDRKPTEVRGQTAKHGHVRQTTSTRAAAAAVADDAHSTPFSSLVWVTAHPGDFACPPAVPDPLKSRSRSLFVGDELINPHPRFGTLTANIRERRGKKVEILVPLFVDENTTLPSRRKNIPMKVELRLPTAVPSVRGRASVSHFAVDNIELTNRGVAEGGGGQGAASAARLPGREQRAARTGAARLLTPTDNAEGKAEAGADGSASADPTGKIPRVANGSDAEDGSTSSDEMHTREKCYRQLMLEGKILHDGQCIYMDAMGFGMGMHCVQATFGCPSMRDARYLYDQLAVLAPLWLSLSAATPFMRGLLAAVDSRWDVIAACVDCRTDAEKRILPKSRYGTASLYISDEAPLTEHLSFYNDVPAPVNDRAFAALVENGVDEILARHVAFLFVRDPLVIFKDKLLAHKLIRFRKDLSNPGDRGVANAATGTSDGSAATAVSASSGVCSTATAATVPTPTSVSTAAVIAVSPTSTNTAACGTPMCIRSSPPPLTAAALARTCCSASHFPFPARVPLQEQRDALEYEDQQQHAHHKEEEEDVDEDEAVVAEAAIDWGIDDGTVYTTTQDFENLQSTNWNSVRFKPPAAFKPWTIPATPAAPADACCGREHDSVAETRSESNSRSRKESHKNSSRRWSWGSNSGSWRTRTNQVVETRGACSVSGSGRVRGEREGGLDKFENGSKCRSNRGNSLGTIAATQPFVAAEYATDGRFGGRSRCFAARAAGGNGDAGAEAGGKGVFGRPSLCSQKLQMRAEGEEHEAATASARTKLPVTRGEDSSSSSSPLLASSPNSLPSSSASPSAGTAIRDYCTTPWRVEFRTPEMQLTDFENVACLSLVSVLVQVILEERLDLYLPMSLNDENKRRAVECNSILRRKFWFRNDVQRGTADRSFAELSLHQILFGVSASRVSDASPLQMQRDSPSSTRWSSAPSSCRSLLLSSPGSIPPSPLSVSPITASPFSCGTSSTAVLPQVPSGSVYPPCSPVCSPYTPTVGVPSAKPRGEIASPVLRSTSRLPVRSFRVQTSVDTAPRGSSPQLHVKDGGAADESLPSASTPSAETLSTSDVVAARTAFPSCAVLRRSPVSASAALCVCADPSNAGAAAISGGAHTTSREASSSAASSVPRVFSPPSLPPSASHFMGLVPLCLRYIEKEMQAGRCSREAAAQYLEYFDFLRHRTEGLVPTDASFLRACLAVHPAYNRDSVISERACFDICQLAIKVGHGECHVPELFGPFAGRAGMRVSTDCCGFDNGVPVVTSSFFSHFVSYSLKKRLRGYVVEVPDFCWQQKEHLCAHMRWETTEGAAHQERRATAVAAAAAPETQRVNPLADAGGQEGMRQELRQIKVTASAGNDKALNERGAAGGASCSAAPIHESATTEGGARVGNDTATIQRGTEGTPAALQFVLEKEPAGNPGPPRKTAATRKNAASNVEVVGPLLESPRASEAGNGESCGRVGATEEHPLKKEAAACREPSTSVACRSDPSTRSPDGEVPWDNRSQGCRTPSANESESSILETRDRGEEFLRDAEAHAGRNELQKDREGNTSEGEASGQTFGNQKTSTLSHSACATTERKAHYPLLLDQRPTSLLQEKSSTDSVQPLTVAPPRGRAGTRGEEDVSWGVLPNVTSLSGADIQALSGEGVRAIPFCKAAAAAASREPAPVVALGGGFFAGQAEGSSARVSFRPDKADRRIVFALSGKAAVSLCTADTVSALRSCTSGPVCRISDEARNSARAAPDGGGAGRKRICNVYSGWRACASVGVTNEEATGVWLSLTSGLHCSWCHDDSGSTSCPSTDDDRESGDEVCSIPRLLFSSGEVMAYSRAVLDASA